MTLVEPRTCNQGAELTKLAACPHPEIRCGGDDETRRISASYQARRLRHKRRLRVLARGFRWWDRGACWSFSLEYLIFNLAVARPLQ